MSRQNPPDAATSTSTAATAADDSTSSLEHPAVFAESASISLTGESPLRALLDSCRAIAQASPTADAPRASDTPLFSSILDAVLLKQRGDAGAAKTVIRGGATLSEKEVVSVLTRLLAADELLEGCCKDGWPGDQGARDSSTPAPNGGPSDAVLTLSDIDDLFEYGFGFGNRRRSDVSGCSSSGSGGLSKPTKFSISEPTDLDYLLPRAPRRVCQYAFRQNDIVWICKQCQADETCVLCNECFRNSDHEGHEVFFYHAQIPAGGCCDCGDPDAWDPSGFCRSHGLDNLDPLKELPPGIATSGPKVMQGVRTFLVDTMESIARSFDLSNPFRVEDGEIQMISIYVHENMQEGSYVEHTLTTVMGTSRKSRAARMKLRVGQEEEAEVLSDSVMLKWYLMDMATTLARRGLLVSVRSNVLQARLERMVSVMSWLYETCTISDGTCRLVCNILDVPTLLLLTEVNPKLPKDLARGFHDLYLTLMADQPFKTRIAVAYVRTLPITAQNYIRGVGSAEFALFTLSVQFLNRSAFVKDLEENHRLLEILIACLRMTLTPAYRKMGASSDRPEDVVYKMDSSHLVLRNRRYTPIIADLKCVLNIEGVPPRFLTMCFSQWIDILRMVHHMTPQIRHVRTHVEHEGRDWMISFNLIISLTSLFECLLGWLREPVGKNASIPSGFFSSQAPPQSTTARDEATDPSRPTLKRQRQHQQEQSMPTPSLSPRELFRATFDAIALWYRGSDTERYVRSSGSSGTLVELCLPPVAPPLRQPRHSENELPHHPQESAFEGHSPAVALATVRGARQGEGGSGNQGASASALEQGFQPAYPRGVLRIGPLPVRRSFHITIHRFFAAMIREACACGDRGEDLRQLKKLMISYPEVTTEISDTPLLVLAFAAEIRSGLWLRNGQSMSEQVFNYANSNFCKMFRDLDLFLVHFTGLACGANQLVNHVLHRFQCFYWIFEEYNTPAASAATASAGATPTPPTGATMFYGAHGDGRVGMEQRLLWRPTLDLEQQLYMAEECLLLLILLVTEMPSPPNPKRDAETPAEGSKGGSSSGVRPDSPAGRQIRRELVHRLASAPRTRSELQDTPYESVESELLEAILKDIATRREPSSALKSGMFELKPEMFTREYDSTFFHMSLEDHQKAGERRPPIKGPTPVCPPPPEAHPLFLQLRVDLLKTRALVRSVGQVLLGCVRPSLGRSRDALLLRSLHLLTLAVHTMMAHAEDNARQRDVEAFCSAVLEAGVRPPSPMQPAQAEMPDVEFGGLRAPRGDTDGLDPTRLLLGSLVRPEGLPGADAPLGSMLTGPQLMTVDGIGVGADERGCGLAHVSVLGLLLELKGTHWAKTDKMISGGTDWLLDRLAEMSTKCREVITPPPPRETAAGSQRRGEGEAQGGESGATVSASTAAAVPSTLSMEMRKAARKRAMDLIRKNAKSFMEGSNIMTSMTTSPDKNSDAPKSEEKIGQIEQDGVRDGGGRGDDLDVSRKGGGGLASSLAGGAVGRPARPESPECIVCYEDTGHALGYVGFARRSRVLDVRMKQERSRPGVHLQFCGHALHYACFDQYNAIMLQAHGRSLSLDIQAGEFHCPLCKSLSNLMVPAMPAPGEGEPETEKWRARAKSRKITKTASTGFVAEDRGDGAWGRPLEDRDYDMDVSEDKHEPICRSDGWREAKAALALDRASGRTSPTLVNPPPLPPPPPLRLFGGWGLATMEVGEGGQDASPSRRKSEPPLDPAVGKFLKSMYKVTKGTSVLTESIAPEDLFLTSCRALAYSICSAATVISPLDAVGRLAGGGARSGAGAEGAEKPTNSPGDLTRLRYLQQVAMVLRAAARQGGLGDTVRRKLAASLRAELPRDQADHRQGQQEKNDPALATKGRGWEGGNEAKEESDDDDEVGDLERPILLTRAMEMLVVAIVLLPSTASEDAMHCVSALCLVRVLQVLHCYQDKERIQADTTQPQLKITEMKQWLETASTSASASSDDGGGGCSSENKALNVSTEDVAALFLDKAGTQPAAASRGTAKGAAGPMGDSLTGDNCRWAESSGLVTSRLGAASASASASTTGAGANGGTAGSILRFGDAGSSIFGASFLVGGRKAAAHRLRTFAADDDDAGASPLFPYRSMSVKETKEPAVGRETVKGFIGGSTGHDRYTRVAAPHVTAFLRTALLVLHVCSNGRAEQQGEGEDQVAAAGGLIGADGSPFPSADDAFEPLCRFFGFPYSTEAILSEPGVVEAARRWLLRSSSGESYGGWLPWEESLRQIMHVRLFDFPVPVKMDLVRLPHAYTELHAEVTYRSRSRTSHPAVCLVCAEILDSHGVGECTRHAGLCGAGVGVMFLLQECKILLIHHPRAAFFPTPYVNAYGEQQRHNLKGRPLYLDERRYDLVRRLWVNHLVAHEVVNCRATSGSVILNEYY